MINLCKKKDYTDFGTNASQELEFWSEHFFSTFFFILHTVPDHCHFMSNKRKSKYITYIFDFLFNFHLEKKTENSKTGNGFENYFRL